MSFKLSHYAIISDPVDGQDLPDSKRVLFSARLAQTLVVKNSLLDTIRHCDWHLLDDSTLLELLKSEVIVPAEENELRTIVSRNKAAIEDEHTLAFVIQPTAQCQLGCGYCGQQHSKGTLSEDFYDIILQRLAAKFENSKHYSNLQIYWFGAEPILGIRHIRALTPALRKMAAERNCSYAARIVTNGLSLKENIFEELVSFGINEFEITLDGTADYHDVRRYTKEGVHTFDLIYANLVNIITDEKFLSTGAKISIRCNVDARNHEGVLPLLAQMKESGILDKVSFYVAPIHSWGNDAHKISMTPEEFADKEIDWLIELSKTSEGLAFMPNLKRVTCLAVTNDGELVDAFGNFYNCTEISYVPAYEGTELILGNIRDVAPTDNGKRPFKDFGDKIERGEMPCSVCQVLPVCGGNCPKSWREEIPPCPSFKYNINDRMLLTYINMRSSITELTQ